MKFGILVLFLLIVVDLESRDVTDRETHILYSCDSLSGYSKKEEKERLLALFEFIRKEKNILNNHGIVEFWAIETNSGILRDVTPDFGHQLFAAGILVVAADKSKNLPKSLPVLADGKMFSDGKSAFYLGNRIDRKNSYTASFYVTKKIPLKGNGEYFFIKNKDQALYGFRNGYYYLNCAIPYGVVGRLKLVYRDGRIIRQSHDAIQINLDKTSNSWVVP